MDGKKICNKLKYIRKRIADANGISYVPSECHFKGECDGTCPKCEKELQKLNEQIRARKLSGMAASVVGVALGIGTLSTPTPASAQTHISHDSIQKIPIDTLDWSNGSTNCVVVRGEVKDDDCYPLTACTILLKNTKNGILTDNYGRYCIKAPVGSTLVFDFIGCKKVELQVTADIKSPRNIYLENEKQIVTGLIAVSRSYSYHDDVYGRYTSKKDKKKKKDDE